MNREPISGVRIGGSDVSGLDRVLTPAALELVAALERRFGGRREELLEARRSRQERNSAGELPDFLPATRDVRTAAWTVAATPPDLEDRRVEITGPASDAKMVINALNSGASVFMADFEDSLSPTWRNVIGGQANLQEAVRGALAHDTPAGKAYRLAPRRAVLMVRPRGWHLTEPRLTVDGRAVSAGMFDLGLFLFHNGRELLERGTGPYFYLPKLESQLEARLWNDVFVAAQDALGIPRGSIRATVLVENVLAAFEKEEILYELREHSAGLNAGRWDYIFSIIRKLRDVGPVLPDRVQIGMTVPFMHAYAELLVATCHRRGAHAIGGMAAFIPSRRDEEVNRVALEKVREDKLRESGQGFDGTWIAHPDLVPVVLPIFETALEGRPHQKHRLREDVEVTANDLLDLTVPGGRITEAGLRLNVSVGLRYLASWLSGVGAAGIFNLMEDTATAEISRAQLWQWAHRGGVLDDGRPADLGLYRRLRDEELARLEGVPHAAAAADILDRLVEPETFPEFLTLEAMDLLERTVQ